jgi:large subunit ribosomal protein L18
MGANVTGRERRKRRVRKQIFGTAERPRLSVFRSNTQIYAQVIDDVSGKTIASATSLGGESAEGAKLGAAAAVGEKLAAACKDKGVSAVVFDRNGYIYTGRVKALADGARKGGLQF